MFAWWSVVIVALYVRLARDPAPLTVDIGNSGQSPRLRCSSLRCRDPAPDSDPRATGVAPVWSDYFIHATESPSLVPGPERFCFSSPAS